MLKSLRSYLVNDILDGRDGNVRTCNNSIFLMTPSVALAGYFINDFFQKHYTKFNKKPPGKLISEFKI